MASDKSKRYCTFTYKSANYISIDCMLDPSFSLCFLALFLRQCWEMWQWLIISVRDQHSFLYCLMPLVEIDVCVPINMCKQYVQYVPNSPSMILWLSFLIFLSYKKNFMLPTWPEMSLHVTDKQDDHAFAVAGPILWNNLMMHMKTAQKLDMKKLLKAYLFCWLLFQVELDSCGIILSLKLGL